MCVSDNGTELTGMGILRWSQSMQDEWHYIAPGKLEQNAFIESFTDVRVRLAKRDHRHLAGPSREALVILKDVGNLARRTVVWLNWPPAFFKPNCARNATGRGAALRRGLRAPPQNNRPTSGLESRATEF